MGAGKFFYPRLSLGQNFGSPYSEPRFFFKIDIALDSSRSLKVKCDGGIGRPYIYFVIVLNSNARPNLAPLRDISVQNLSDIESNLPRSLNAKSNGVAELPICICNFQLVSNSINMSVNL